MVRAFSVIGRQSAGNSSAGILEYRLLVEPQVFARTNGSMVIRLLTSEGEGVPSIRGLSLQDQAIGVAKLRRIRTDLERTQ